MVLCWGKGLGVQDCTMTDPTDTFWKEVDVLESNNEGKNPVTHFWEIREEEFFSSHGLSTQQVKLIAGLGMCLTGFLMTAFLVYLCSKLSRPSEVGQTTKTVNKSSIILGLSD